MIKYTSTEQTEILSPQAHARVANRLSRLAKQRVEDLEDEDREDLLKELEDE